MNNLRSWGVLALDGIEPKPSPSQTGFCKDIEFDKTEAKNSQAQRKSVYVNTTLAWREKNKK